jgi:LytS/YehU family sensor histidine kinase
LALLLIWAWQSSPIYNRIGALALGIGFGGAMLQLAVAVVRRRRGAMMAAAGLAGSGISLWLAPRDFLDQAFFISVGPAVLGLLVALTLQLRDERREARQAILTAARLEIELLKKNLQPHFLLNTLATIQEVIEQDSRGAVALIDALAAEFRILSRVSGEKLIPLAEELELCRAHLRVMSLRKGAHCTLQVEGVDERDLVPPALFHTLVENGLTHLLPIDGQQRFTLVGSVNGSRVRYVFTAWGRRAAGSTEASGTGTGLRYLRARLEESFPGAWSLDATPLPEGWETRLEFRRATLAR